MSNLQIKRELEVIAHDIKRNLGAMSHRLTSVESAFNLTPIKKTAGQQFIESEVGKQIFENESNTANGASNKPVTIKAITGDPASAGATVDDYRYGELISTEFNTERIQNILPVTMVVGGAVEVTRVNVFTNNAGAQAGELATKPESDITYELVKAATETFAHWMTASRQVLSDASLLRDDIDSHLIEGLLDTIEAQLLYGDGTGNNLTGLFVDADVPTVGVRGSLTYTRHVRQAITKVHRANYRPDYVIMSPEGWENCEAETGTDGHYTWANPQNEADRRLWGIPCLVTSGLTENDFMVGSFRRGVRIFEKHGITLRVSEDHADLFVKNGVALLSENEMTSVIMRPTAFCKGSFAAA